MINHAEFGISETTLQGFREEAAYFFKRNFDVECESGDFENNQVFIRIALVSVENMAAVLAKYPNFHNEECDDKPLQELPELAHYAQEMGGASGESYVWYLTDIEQYGIICC